MDSAIAIHREVGEFINRTANSLPMPANMRLMRFFNDYHSHFQRLPTNPGERFEQVLFCLTALRRFNLDVDYLLADTEMGARNLVERAFLHLQRQIIADQGVRQTLQYAYREGETACEKLGATHIEMRIVNLIEPFSPMQMGSEIVGQGVYSATRRLRRWGGERAAALAAREGRPSVVSNFLRRKKWLLDRRPAAAIGERRVEKGPQVLRWDGRRRKYIELYQSIDKGFPTEADGTVKW